MTYEQGRKPASLFQSAECLRCKRTIQAGAVNWVHIKMGPYKGRKQHRDCQQADDWLGWLPQITFGSNLTEALQPQTQPTTTQEPVQVSGDLAQLLAAAISPYIQASDSKVEGKLKDFENKITQLLSDIEDSVNAKLNTPSNTLEVHHIETQEVVKLENVHPRFETLLKLCIARKKVYIYGPAGSGKSTAAEQVAEVLKLNYYTISLNRQSAPWLLTGFMGANGTQYVTTAFRQAWQYGGVLLIDEFDNASGNLLTTLNTGLANGHMSFPDSPLAIPRHKDCVILTAGNTCLRGADRQYNERQQLDAATIDRFVFLEWNYDEAFERKLALQRNPNATSWIDYVQFVRLNCARLNIRVAITPRASLEGADLLLAGFTRDECVEMLLRKGLDQDTWNKIK